MNPVTAFVGLIVAGVASAAVAALTGNPAFAAAVGVPILGLACIMALETRRPTATRSGLGPTRRPGSRSPSGSGSSRPSGSSGRSGSGDDGGVAVFGALSYPALSSGDNDHSSGGSSTTSSGSSSSSCSSSSCSSSSCGGS